MRMMPPEASASWSAPQVGEQLLGLHAQFAVVDEDLRAALAVDRDPLAVDPDAGRPFEQFGAVLSDGRGGVRHVYHEAVGLAADQLRLHLDALDLRGRGLEDDVAQIVAVGDADRARRRFEAEILHRERVGARGDLQREAPFVVGDRAGSLLRAAEQHDGGPLYGGALFVDDATRYGGGPGRRKLRNGRSQCHDEEDDAFHTFAE